MCEFSCHVSEESRLTSKAARQFIRRECGAFRGPKRVAKPVDFGRLFKKHGVKTTPGPGLQPLSEAELEKVVGGAKDPSWRPGGAKGSETVSTDASVFDRGKAVLDKFNVYDAYVKPKHLSTTIGNARQFLGATKDEAEIILKDAIKNGKVISIIDDGISKLGQQKYAIILDAGKVVGTRGETFIKIVLSNDGGMLSAYPKSL